LGEFLERFGGKLEKERRFERRKRLEDLKNDLLVRDGSGVEDRRIKMTRVDLFPAEMILSLVLKRVSLFVKTVDGDSGSREGRREADECFTVHESRNC